MSFFCFLYTAFFLVQVNYIVDIGSFMDPVNFEVLCDRQCEQQLQQRVHRQETVSVSCEFVLGSSAVVFVRRPFGSS